MYSNFDESNLLNWKDRRDYGRVFNLGAIQIAFEICSPVRCILSSFHIVFLRRSLHPHSRSGHEMARYRACNFAVTRCYRERSDSIAISSRRFIEDDPFISDLARMFGLLCVKAYWESRSFYLYALKMGTTSTLITIIYEKKKKNEYLILRLQSESFLAQMKF